MERRPHKVSDNMDIIFSVFLSLFGLFFSGVGLWFVGVGLKNIFFGFISRRWQPTIGTIVSSRVKIDSGRNAARSGAVVIGGAYKYSAEVLYEYTAGNVQRTGDKVFFSEINSRDLRSIQSVVHRYPAPSTTTVYFDPARPQRAVLEPGVKAGNLAALIVGGLFALLGVGIVFAALFGFERLFGLVAPAVFFRIVTSLGVVAGASALILGIVMSRRARASRKWPIVRGLVVSSKVLKDLSSSSNIRQTGRVVGDHQYKAEVAFEYTVLGVKYIANTVTVGDYSTNTPGHAENITARYPEGKAVDVFYNPRNPEQAVLETTGGFGLWLVFFAGFFLLAISALFIYLGPERFAK